MAESKNDIVRCGLIQCSNPINDESVPVADDHAGGAGPRPGGDKSWVAFCGR